MTLPWENRVTLSGLLWGVQITVGICTTVVGTICQALSSFMLVDCRDRWSQPSFLLPWHLLQYAVWVRRPEWRIMGDQFNSCLCGMRQLRGKEEELKSWT